MILILKWYILERDYVFIVFLGYLTLLCFFIIRNIQDVFLLLVGGEGSLKNNIIVFILLPSSVIFFCN